MSLAADTDKYPKMTKKSIRAICKKLNQYLTPELNDILYLHFQGFSRIENLDEYTGLKCLWLESNGVCKIENIGHLLELKCLYLQQNLIEEIENLETLIQLDTLNLSNNSLTKLQNLSHLTKLHTLQVSHNYFKTADDIMELKLCPSIGILDLQHNKLNDTNIIDIFSEMPNLGVLTLQGNPVVNTIKNYRKFLICSISSLKFLDDRPVFDKDRSAAIAWEKGGLVAEREERQRWTRMEQERILASVNALRVIRNRNFGNENGNQITEVNNPSDNSVELECEETPRALSVNSPIGDGTEPYNVLPPVENIDSDNDTKNITEPFLITEIPSDTSIEEIDLTTNRNASFLEPNCSIFSDTSRVKNNSLLFDFNQSNAAVESNKPRRPLVIEECEDEILQTGTNCTFRSPDCVAQVDIGTERDSHFGTPLITEIDTESDPIVPIGTNENKIQVGTSLITEIDTESDPIVPIGTNEIKVQIGTSLITEIDTESDPIVPIGTNENKVQVGTSLITEIDTESDPIVPIGTNEIRSKLEPHSSLKSIQNQIP